MTEQERQQARKRLQGLRSRAGGAGFEAEIDRALAYINGSGAALIEKTPEPMRVVRRMEQGKFVAVFTKKAQPDYKGLLDGGRAVVFEAKHTDTDRIEQDRVSKAQAEYLTQAAALGADCYVIAGFRGGGVYRVPWSMWCGMKDWAGHKYVSEKDLERYRVRRARNGTLLLLEGGGAE